MIDTRMNTFGVRMLVVSSLLVFGFGCARSAPIVEEAASIDSLDALFVGDVMLGRYVGELVRQKGQEYLFAEVGELFDSYDYVVANLEGPVTELNNDPGNDLRFHFDPSVVGMLVHEGIDFVSVANNHGLDQGVGGLEETREYLAAGGVIAFGDPMNAPAEVTVGDGSEQMMLFGYNVVNGQFDVDAAEESVAVVDDALFTVIFLHWGTEYDRMQNDAQRQVAHRFIDAGADLVVGHHPHVVQGVEVYNGVPIVYSLGNFIFDQYFEEDVQQGLGVGVHVEAEQVRLQLVPFASEHSQPRLMHGPERDLFLHELAGLSDPLLEEGIVAGELVVER